MTLEPPRLDVLRQRRAMLQLRLARQRHAQTARELARSLHGAGLRRLSRLPPARGLALLAPFAHWPAQDERFVWTGIAGARCASWSDSDERDALFRRALAECAPADQRIVLLFHTVESGLVLDSGEASRVATLLLEPLHATVWVLPLRGHPWLIELSFGDSELCWLAPGSLR